MLEVVTMVASTCNIALKSEYSWVSMHIGSSTCVELTEWSNELSQAHTLALSASLIGRNRGWSVHSVWPNASWHPCRSYTSMFTWCKVMKAASRSSVSHEAGVEINRGAAAVSQKFQQQNSQQQCPPNKHPITKWHSHAI